MRIPIALLAVALSTSSAGAWCFEGLGCTDQQTFPIASLRLLSCQNLWTVRNSVYDDNGYCFRSSAAQAVFDNTGCWVHDQAQVRMNTQERTNVNRVVQVEGEKGC